MGFGLQTRTNQSDDCRIGLILDHHVPSVFQEQKAARSLYLIQHMSILPSLLLFLLLQRVRAATFDYPSANLSTTWINSLSAPHTVSFSDGSTVTAVLLRQISSFGPSFAFGFHCAQPCTSYLLAVYILYTNSGAGITLSSIPQLVWSANRESPVRQNATLHLTLDGDLQLLEADRSLVWSTGTKGKSVAKLTLTERGNLMLLDGRDNIVWQSFDHPTDTLLSGQKLVEGQKLTANASVTDFSGGRIYLTYTTDTGFGAFVDSNPPLVYHQFPETGPVVLSSRGDPCFLNVTAGALTFFANSSSLNGSLLDPPVSATQFVRLESDGHMKLYEWLTTADGWNPTADAIKLFLGDCAFPTVCGSYGVCSSGQCSCPQEGNSTAYFRRVDVTLPNRGCTTVTPLSCQSPQLHQFLVLEDVSYFSDELRYPNSTTEKDCKEFCLRNCSCKAAVFRYGSNASDGSCYLPQEIFSLMKNVQVVSHYNSTVYIKVQAPPASPPPLSSSPSPSSNNSSTSVIIGSTVGAVIGVVLILGLAVMVYRKRRAIKEQDDEEDDFPQLPGMPARFTYEDLRAATENFARKLGGGGFGSVFDGTLLDGTRVAVKKLESVRQGKREFMAEVETIGSIHHLNLVRLIGFCAERSYRLLVYEHMSNGSLEKWIFRRTEDGGVLPWEVRRRIIYDVARGLLYLHEECRQKIAHLDIKPQNILLDSSFNAKVSDFGLAKLIERDQSAVMTMMRGTPGYLAPEWLTSFITEKVDVYSFGVVVAEIVCARKNLDYSQPEETVHLLALLKDKATLGQLVDVIYRCPEDMQADEMEMEMEKMLRLAIWCLQNDTGKRPSMSMVVRALDGAMEIPGDLEIDFTTPVQRIQHKTGDSSGSTPLLDSVLSGPR